MTEAGGELQSRPFTYDRADFAALARLPQPRIVRWLFVLAWVLVVLAVILIVLAAVLGDPVQTRWVAALAALTVLTMVLQRLGPELGGWVQLLVHRKSGLLSEQQMSVLPDVFRVESERGTSELKWAAVPRVQTDEDRLFVFVTKQVAYIVPGRAFDDGGFERFTDVVLQRWRSTHDAVQP